MGGPWRELAWSVPLLQWFIASALTGFGVVATIFRAVLVNHSRRVAFAGGVASGLIAPLVVLGITWLSADGIGVDEMTIVGLSAGAMASCLFLVVTYWWGHKRLTTSGCEA